MSLMLAPTPAAPDTPAFTPPEGAPRLERSPRFGPALSDARERLARAEPAREPARRPDAEADRPARSDDRRPTRAEGRPDDVSSPNDATEDTDAGDDAEASTDVDGESAETTEAAEAETTEVDAAPAPTVVASAASDAITASTDLVITDGAEGAGDPSTSDSVEEVAAPIVTETPLPLGDESDAETLTSSEALRPAASQALPSATAEAVAPFVLGQRMASNPEPEAVAVSADTTIGTSAAASATTGGEPTESAAPTLDQQAAPATTEGNEGGDDVTATEAAPTETVEPEAASTASEAEPVEAAAPKPLTTSPVTSETPDRAVVRAGEAAATDVAKAAVTQPTDGPEGSLWEDVRSAFERIRSNGETNEVRIRLRPAELGELVVQVRTQGDHVAVRLLASSAAAQQALLDDRLRLASELALAGFEEGSVDIDQQMADDPRSQNGQRDGEGEERPAPRSIDMLGGLDHAGAVRERFERRNPIHTEVGFRPGRHAYSTINLTL